MEQLSAFVFQHLLLVDQMTKGLLHHKYVVDPMDKGQLEDDDPGYHHLHCQAKN